MNRELCSNRSGHIDAVDGSYGSAIMTSKEMADVSRSYNALDHLIEELGQVYMALDSPLSLEAKKKFVDNFYLETRKLWKILIIDHQEKIQDVYDKLKWAFMAMLCYRISFQRAVICVRHRISYN